MKQPRPLTNEGMLGIPNVERTIGARGASGVGIGSAVAAASGFLITLIVARTLPPAETAQFLIFWSLLFGLFGVLSGIQSETTRAVRSAVLADRDGTAPLSTRVLPAGLLVGGMLSVVVLATSVLWTGELGTVGTSGIIVAITLAGVAYSGHTTLAGASAGRQDWHLYSWLMIAESLVRLVAVAGVVLLAASLAGIEIACTVAALVWIGFLCTSRRARAAAVARVDVTFGALLRQHCYALVSAAATAALIVGFPLMFSLTSSPGVVASSAGILLAVQLTRAPIMIPLQAFQGVAIASFVTSRARGLRALIRPVAVIGAIALIGALLAWWIGPWLMLIFGEAYVVDGEVLGLLTLGAGAMATLTLTGAATLAAGRHRAYTFGWVVATLVSLALLLVPASTDARVVLSLCVGPVVGIVAHCIGISARPGGRFAVANGTDPA